MKRVYLTLNLFLGILCFSCGNNAKTDNKTTVTEPVKNSKKIEVTKHPDTIIDGVRVYNFTNVNVKAKEINIEEAINLFDASVYEAKTCEQLIKACATFDANVKKISQKDPSVKYAEVEKREDVKSIRKNSEEKSLRLCQTQQIR